MTSHQLLEIIECKRKELFSVVSENGIDSPTTIMHSQQLDKLINIYLSNGAKKKANQAV